MSDTISLNPSQVINGIAVLLSFFVGYKYAIKRHYLDESTQSSKNEVENKTSPEHIFSNAHSNYKMVLVVRNDLKMGKGKVGAQCGHGAVGAFEKAIKRVPQIVRAWQNSGCAKIALRVESETELLSIKRVAGMHNLITCMVVDAGRTQIEPNTKTVLAIGPAAVEDIDKITGHLKLL